MNPISFELFAFIALLLLAFDLFGETDRFAWDGKIKD